MSVAGVHEGPPACRCALLALAAVAALAGRARACSAGTAGWWAAAVLATFAAVRAAGPAADLGRPACCWPWPWRWAGLARAVRAERRGPMQAGAGAGCCSGSPWVAGRGRADGRCCCRWRPLARGAGVAGDRRARRPAGAAGCGRSRWGPPRRADAGDRAADYTAGTPSWLLGGTPGGAGLGTQLRDAAAQPGLRAVPVHARWRPWRCCGRWPGRSGGVPGQSLRRSAAAHAGGRRAGAGQCAVAPDRPGPPADAGPGGAGRRTAAGRLPRADPGPRPARRCWWAGWRRWGRWSAARDLSLAPEELASLHLTARIAWPPGLDLRPWLLGVGVVVATAAVMLFGLPLTPAGPDRRARLWFRRRTGAPFVLLAAGAGLSLVLAHHLVPALSPHLSNKHLLDSYHRHRGPDAALALYPGIAATGLLVPAETRRCPGGIRAGPRRSGPPGAVRPGPSRRAGEHRGPLGRNRTPYVVVDARSSRLLLLAARAPADSPESQPAAPVRLAPGPGSSAPPWSPPRQPARRPPSPGPSQLLGADFPATVRRPGRLPLTLHFQVAARPPPG